MSDERAWPRCTEACATPVPCPTCGADLPPIGRSSGLPLLECCSDAQFDSAINTRHIWNVEELNDRWSDT